MRGRLVRRCRPRGRPELDALLLALAAQFRPGNPLLLAVVAVELASRAGVEAWLYSTARLRNSYAAGARHREARLAAKLLRALHPNRP
jgi:Arc/MetJ family transcription regulator